VHRLLSEQHETQDNTASTFKTGIKETHNHFKRDSGLLYNADAKQPSSWQNRPSSPHPKKMRQVH
jgi:hypothetical protein